MKFREKDYGFSISQIQNNNNKISVVIKSNKLDLLNICIKIKKL